MVDDGQGPGFLGRGWAFPVGIARDTGLVESACAQTDIQQSILIILSTAKGERPMRPDFGCGIHDLVFAAVSTQLAAQIDTTVRDALRTYEARIVVKAVTVRTDRLADGRLDVVVDYEVRATNQPGNFVYPFYFQESGSG